MLEEVKASGRMAMSGDSSSKTVAAPTKNRPKRSIASASCRVRRGQAAVNAIEHQGRRQQHDAERAGHAPVGRSGRVESDHGADHLVLGTADQGGRDVVAE